MSVLKSPKARNPANSALPVQPPAPRSIATAVRAPLCSSPEGKREPGPSLLLVAQYSAGAAYLQGLPVPAANGVGGVRSSATEKELPPELAREARLRFRGTRSPVLCDAPQLWRGWKNLESLSSRTLGEGRDSGSAAPRTVKGGQM